MTASVSGAAAPDGDASPPAAAPRVCAICGSALPLRAKGCAKCRSAKVKEWVKSGYGIAFAVLGLVSTTLGIMAMWPKAKVAESGAAIIENVNASDDATLLVVRVKNGGTGESQVSRRFTLSSDETGLLDFGALRLLSPAEWTVVPPLGEVTLRFEIAFIKPQFDVRRDDFWMRYGDKTVTLIGKVSDSGTERVVVRRVPLVSLREFITRRSDDPPAGRPR
jgi:hypothetical protein